MLTTIIPTIKRKIALLPILLVLMLTAASCHELEMESDDHYGNFDAIVKIVDEHYCFFDSKGIDWQRTAAEYRAKIDPEMSDNDFFNLCASLLDELRDGHVNLSSRFNTSSYRKWWSDYPQDFNLRTLQEFYLDFDYRTTSGITYKVLEGHIGYLYYPSFVSYVGETNLDYILAYFIARDCDSLIIDVRNNGGGNLTNIDTFVARFITAKTVGGYIRHKTGPGHNDFSEPYPICYDVAAPQRISWHKPIAVLTNRSTFSAANDFVAVMKYLPDVTIIGARTGGGGGLPFTYELPNGWSIRLSASPLTDALGNSIEEGIEPSEGYECHAYSDELAAGRDAILDKAIEHFRQANR